MATNPTRAEEKLLKICKETVNSIIREWSDDIEADPEAVIDENTRYRMKDRVMVDRAIGKMWAKLISRKDNVFAGVEDTEPVLLNAYHYAVDKYFEIYRGIKPTSRAVGRPRTKLPLLCKILELKQAKKTYREICIALKVDPRHSEMIRKRYQEAKKRCPDTGKTPTNNFRRKKPLFPLSVLFSATCN